MERYIDADVLRHDVLYHANAQYCKGNHDKEEAFTYCLYLIDCMPAFELVRCKDCEFWQTDWIPNTGGDRGCHYCEMMDSFTEPLNYCGYAERKILPKD